MLHFRYDETSPTCLVRITNPKTLLPLANPVPAGSFLYQANGTRNGASVKMVGKVYRVQRVIWTLLKGTIPENHVIDHLDGDPWNNKISNLCVKSVRGNAQNLKKSKACTTGIKGVVLYTRKKTATKGETCNAIAVVIDKDFKKIYKSYSVAKYGLPGALSLAESWRIAKLEEFNSTWATYTDRHIHE